MRRALCFFLPFVWLAFPAAAEPAREVPESQGQVILSYAPIVKGITPAVVNIYSKRKIEVQSGISPFAGDPFFQQFMGGGIGGIARERVVSSLGSGVIVDPKGRIVTSNHVISGGEGIVAVLSDGREFPAKVAATDPSSDLALLTIDTKGEALPALTIADSDKLQVGDLVLAVGNPFGVGQTVTSGIVSALARSAAGVSDYQFFIQTDAAINPGNSGGALTDMQGRLVGINTAIYSKTGSNNGIGFAIPANMVAALLVSEKGGSIVRPWIGAAYQSVTPQIANSLGLKRAKGALIEKLVDGAPGIKAGLKPGDVVMKLGDSDIESAESLKYRIAVATAGQQESIVVWRDGKEVMLSITLSNPPENPDLDERALSGNQPMAGVTVANLSPKMAAGLDLGVDQGGVVVVKNESTTQFAPGDLILAVNNRKITSSKQLAEVLAQPSRGWRIVFRRGAQTLTYEIRF